MSLLAGKKILVVDDEPDLREIVKFELELAGAQVLEAPGGHAAFEIVKEHPLDLVLSDARMPEGGGLELLENIKKRDAQKPAVVLMTGFADLSEEEAYYKGIAELIYKPFNPESLVEKVARALQSADTPSPSRTKRTERLQSDFDVKIHSLKNAEIITLKIIDFGIGGMFIATSGPFPEIGELIKFSLNFLDDKSFPIEGTAIVRWRRTESKEGKAQGYGAEFYGLSNAAMQRISDLVAVLKNKKMHVGAKT